MNDQLRQTVEKTIIGLRDGWATRSDADAVLAALAAHPVAGSPAEALRYTSDGTLAECPCCGSLDVGGAHDTVHCYGCGLTVSAPRPLQNAIDKWNRRTSKVAAAEPMPVSEAASVDAEEGIEILDQLIANIEKDGNYSAQATVTFLRQIRQCFAAPAAPTDASELHFNAQRLRNVAALVGLSDAVPADDASLDGARGAVLGQIAAKIRKAQSVRDAAPAPFKERRRFEERG